MLFSKVFAFSSLLATAFAAPFAANVADKRDVVAPPVTSPIFTSVWVVGHTYKVTWDTSGLPPPANITNLKAEVILGSVDNNGQKRLNFTSPLAQGFLITAGSVDVVVPSVPSGRYFVVLFGDSGDDSQTFTITSDSTSASASPSTPASSPTPTSASSSTPAPASSSSSSSASTPSVPAVSDSVAASSSSSVSTPDVTPSAPTSVAPLSSTSVVPSPAPSGNSSSGGTAVTQQSGALSWLNANSCLTFAAVAFSAALLA
ncbi:hypothetical protein BDW22DRAFT_1348078 [Trametopsis cervina]|nr:hypothetical protein BDW22DRAFT_1348078 [Trametopsis cervina]